MGIEYTFNTGWGFLLPEDKFALPAEWNDVELWYDGDVDAAISGSGIVSVYGGDNWSGPRLWGFVAESSWSRLCPRDSNDVIEVQEIEPHILSNMQDLRARVKMPKARIGWMLWKDTH